MPADTEPGSLWSFFLFRCPFTRKFGSRMHTFRHRAELRCRHVCFASGYERLFAGHHQISAQAYALLSQLVQPVQNSIRRQIRAFSMGVDFSQSAYDQKDMSLCAKPNQRKNHRIWRAKRVLQLPLLYVPISIHINRVLLNTLSPSFRKCAYHPPSP